MFEPPPDLPDLFTIYLIGGPFDHLTAQVRGKRTPPWWIYVARGPDGGRPVAFHPQENPPEDAQLYALGARHNDGSYSARHQGTMRWRTELR